MVRFTLNGAVVEAEGGALPSLLPARRGALQFSRGFSVTVRRSLPISVPEASPHSSVDSLCDFSDHQPLHETCQLSRYGSDGDLGGI